jgi:hypothetical protein
MNVLRKPDYYNRHANPYTGNPGDATFPRHIFLSSYSPRLGTKPAPPAAPPALVVPKSPEACDRATTIGPG